jgi:hypothetical protein
MEIVHIARQLQHVVRLLPFTSYELFPFGLCVVESQKPNKFALRLLSMAQRPIRWFDPRERRPHAPSVPQEEWEKYRARLKQMYLEDGLKLEEIMKMMKDEYSFAPSYVHPPLRAECL